METNRELRKIVRKFRLGEEPTDYIYWQTQLPRMKRRIALWATAGALVAAFWVLYASATFPSQLTAERHVWTLLWLTCPVALLGQHYPISFYLVLVANAATYGLAGAALETIRLRHRTG
jgi:hypothetical protein